MELQYDVWKNLENFIYAKLSRPLKIKQTNDIILGDIFKEEIYRAAILKNIQMRIGLLWEEIASEFFGWVKVKGIDLVHPERKLAVEVKNSDNTDNSSSRERNKQKLLEAGAKLGKGYKLLYLCINCNDGVLKRDAAFGRGAEGGIILLKREYALEILYGKYYVKVVEIMRNVVNRIKNSSDDLQLTT